MQKNRLNYLDGLRGFAALSVVIFHLMSALSPALVADQQNNASWIAYSPIAVMWNGTFAVSVFFVLSGFVLTNATLRRHNPFWVDVVIRYFRLAVPTILSTLLAWLLLTSFPSQATELYELTRSRWLQWTYQNEIPNFATALYSGAVDVFFTGGSYFNNVLWTMRPELIGSIICFSICLFNNDKTRIAATVIVFLLILITKKYEYECFIVGICLREAWAAGRLPSRFASLALIFGLIVGSQSGDAAKIIGLEWLPDFLAVGTKNSLLYPLAAGFVVYGCINSATMIRIFSSKLGVFLGSISFPMYLIHVPVLYTLFAYSYLHAQENTFHTIIAIGGFVFFIIIISYAAEIFIERPFLKLLGKLRHQLNKLDSYFRFRMKAFSNLNSL